MTNYYPINLDLREKLCLVVGGGKVAERKVESLLECGGSVRVISPSLTADLKELADQRKISYSQADFQEKDLEGIFLVIGATSDQGVNEQVAQAALKRNILVNIVDAAPSSNFIVPSTHRQGLLNISISTSGASPALAAKIRREIALSFGAEYAEFLEILQEIRPQVISKYSKQEERKRIFQSIIDSDILELIKKGNQEKVKERIAECIY